VMYPPLAQLLFILLVSISSVSNVSAQQQAVEDAAVSVPGDQSSMVVPSQDSPPPTEAEAPGLAQNTSSLTPKVTVSEASNWPFVALTLLGMIACILVIAWFVKRFTGMTGMGGKDLSIVSALAVGTRERIAVVDVRGEQFLVGVTAQQISLLHHFDEAPIVSNKDKNSDFAEKLQSILKHSSTKSSENTTHSKAVDDVNQKGSN